ncbi:hypothetical protein DFJ58DRAFT_842002 [Suillus subalutaceus]|uniref:uncharacterized protein n=1 Tax=Suillus subalutaceus TaxID=48586 RepID=UPI001B885FD7|nr:uncharacterized protein DFJ58DRAFT_842002 [Suillus subalutaceus]KAG1852149.1 hypothetical protein DFJ58DRAFT_842002 [Suillus subalutaceus]
MLKFCCDGASVSKESSTATLAIAIKQFVSTCFPSAIFNLMRLETCTIIGFATEASLSSRQNTGKITKTHFELKNSQTAASGVTSKDQQRCTRTGRNTSLAKCRLQYSSNREQCTSRPCQNPDEIKKAAGKLAMNYKHYLADQALPPIERTDKAQLAERLGEC